MLLLLTLIWSGLQCITFIPPQIPELRSRLAKGVELLSQLSSAHQALGRLHAGASSVGGGGDTAEWNALRHKVESAKVCCTRSFETGVRLVVHYTEGCSLYRGYSRIAVVVAEVLN